MAYNSYMKIEWSDFICDTMHLDAAGVGALALLISYYWRTGRALPNHDEDLRKIARLTGSQWKRLKPSLLKFFEVKGDAVYSPKLEAKLKRARAYSQQQSDNASGSKEPVFEGVSFSDRSAVDGPIKIKSH